MLGYICIDVNDVIMDIGDAVHESDVHLHGDAVHESDVHLHGDAAKFT